jgi:hypothetical protein
LGFCPQDESHATRRRSVNAAIQRGKLAAGLKIQRSGASNEVNSCGSLEDDTFDVIVAKGVGDVGEVRDFFGDDDWGCFAEGDGAMCVA